MKFQAFGLFLCLMSSNFAAQIITGTKSANDQVGFEKNLAPISTKALLPDTSDFNGGMNHFLPYMMPTPDQENAGSCLFMSHTAATEVLVNRERDLSGLDNLDLSERYFMNLSKADIGGDLITDWQTDTIYRLNKTGKMYTNEVYPYIKGWYKTGADGLRIFANENDQGAFYGVRANWVIDLNQLSKKPFIRLPKFEREVLFQDPKGNRWNVTSAPDDIVERVKKALDKKTGPVVVIYNHTGFWHAVMVGGYNDTVTNHGCPFVSEFPNRMKGRAQQIREEADQTQDPDAKKKLLSKARLFDKRATQVEESYNKAGGCSERGVFYVRDSIYPTESMPLYDYDPKRSGEESNLNAPVILREYDWLRHLSNHVIHIYTAKK